LLNNYTEIYFVLNQVITVFTWKITQGYARIWNIHVSHGSALTQIKWGGK